MPESTQPKARRTKSSRDLSESEAAKAVPPHILNIVKSVEKRAKKSKKGKWSADDFVVHIVSSRNFRPHLFMD